MSLFHISDLLLGKRLYEFYILEEQRELLLEILRSIDEEQPQALLISGDIYDKPVPPTEAVKLLDDFLTEVSKRGLHTYLIAGNHDSAQRLEFGKEIFGRESIHISGSIGEGLAHVTETDEYGTVEIWLLPFFKPAHVNALLREEEASSYAAAKLLLEREKIDFSKRNVILVHQFVTWRGAAERSDSETLSLGGVDEIDAGLFFDFDYVALGHLHNPQKLGRETVRYAGSPMPYSFSEIHRKKGITVVELKEKGVVSLDFIPLETKRQFREIKGPLEEILAAGRETGGSEDYIRCILTNSEALLDPVGQLRRIYPNLMTLEFEQQAASFSDEVLLDTETARPEELFARFFERQNEKELDETQKKLLECIWKGTEEKA